MTACDGQIDLFTASAPTVREYGARVSTSDGQVVLVGPVKTVEAAEHAGRVNVERWGGSFELMERDVPPWTPVAR